jgi:hypothetical protein
MKSLYVGNLPHSATEAQLEIFSRQTSASKRSHW